MAVTTSTALSMNMSDEIAYKITQNYICKVGRGPMSNELLTYTQVVKQKLFIVRNNNQFLVILQEILFSLKFIISPS